MSGAISAISVTGVTDEAHPPVQVGGHRFAHTGDGPWVTTTIYQRGLDQRESIRWQRTAERAKDVLAPAARVTVVADREADIYAHWDAVPASGFDLLTRANNDRRLAGGGMLFAAAAQFALADTRTIDVRARARWGSLGGVQQ